MLLGAKKVIVIDRLSNRLSMASGADEIIDFEHEDVFERLNDLTQEKARRNASTPLASNSQPPPLFILF